MPGQLLSQSIAMAISAVLKKKLTTLWAMTRRRIGRVVTVTSETVNEVPMVTAK